MDVEPDPPEPLVRGLIELVDKRWTRAEDDAAVARRSLLLLSSLVLGFSVAVLSVALAAAGFVVLVGLAQHHVGGSAPLATALLAAAGASGLTLAAQRRSAGRRGEAKIDPGTGPPARG